MCGRLTQQLASDEIARLFSADDEAGDPGGHFNVAPSQPIQTLLQLDGRRIVTMTRWGLIPAWADRADVGARLINARGETVAEKPAFRASFRRQRCIIPAGAFYEWQRSGRGKVPFAISRRDGSPLALAGIWATWQNPHTDDRIRSCSIITTSANDLMAPIHDRMPVVLPEETWGFWLDPMNEDVAALQSLLRPYPDDALVAHPVSPLVNDVRNDGPHLLAAV